MATDYLGDEMPPGYRRWICPICTAGCTFEAMQWCQDNDPRIAAACPYFKDGVEANNGAFGLMVREQAQ